MYYPYGIEQGWAYLFGKVPESKYFHLCKPVVSVTSIQLCHFRTKVTTDNTQMCEHGCVPMRLYLQKKVVAGFALRVQFAQLWQQWYVTSYKSNKGWHPHAPKHTCQGGRHYKEHRKRLEGIRWLCRRWTVSLWWLYQTSVSPKEGFFLVPPTLYALLTFFQLEVNHELIK